MTLARSIAFVPCLALCLCLSACGADRMGTDASVADDLGVGDLAMRIDAGAQPDLATCAGTADSCGNGHDCIKCAPVPNNTATCTAGACVYACSAGSIMCNNACTDITSDGKNCGKCDRNCNGASCDNGLCKPRLLGEEFQLIGVATDMYNAYVTDFGGNSVAFASLQGGGVPTLFAKNQNGASGIAIDRSNVYWTAVTDGTINFLPIGSVDGTLPTLLANAQAQPTDLAIDADSVYWVNKGDGTVKKVAIKGGQPVTLASGQSGPLRIAVDGTNVYWSNTTDGSIMQTLKNGMGNPIKIATGQSAPNGIAVDAAAVYWVGGGDGTINRAPIGGGAVTVMAKGQLQPYSIAVDANNVYWTNYANRNGGTAAKMPLNGNVPVTIAGPPDTMAPTGISLDATSIYVVDNATGDIFRILK